MGYEVRLSMHASRKVKALPKQVQVAVVRALHALEDDPRPAGAVELAGMKQVYRIREGDYRAVYAVRDDKLIVLVLTAGHRTKVYSASEIETARANAEAFRQQDL